ncbi:MAG: 6-phosphogluconolactonase [Novosphingobium sp.]
MTEARRVTWAEPGDLAAVAERVAHELARPRPLRLCVPGGSTAPKVFAMLAQRGLDWAGVTITLNDDRRVPEDHPASNYGKLRATLPDVTIERLVEGAEVAPFDLVWLGMGEDGHVASLFPHMRAELRPGPCVIATTPIPLPTEAPFDRLSLNWRALLATREVILVVTGEVKRRVITAALAGADLPVATLFDGAGVPAPPPVTIYWSA